MHAATLTDRKCCQERHFGDRGSLTGYIDLYGRAIVQEPDAGTGWRTVWRFGGLPCGGDCLEVGAREARVDTVYTED